MRRLLTTLLFIFVAFTFADNPFADFAGTDSAVFNYIGIRMHDGLAPYRDIFDHKGVLIYIINWLGMFNRSSMVGVWLIECIMLGLSLFLINRWVCRQFDVSVAFFTMLLYCAFFCYCACGGNLTESYAHFFIVPPLLILFKALSLGRITCWQTFLSGVCFGAILFLRPNMTIIAFVVAIFCIENIVRSKDWKVFVRNCVAICLGICASVLPMGLYLIAKGAFSSMVDCYWTFNVRYATASPWQWDNKLLMCLVLILLTIPILRDIRFRRLGYYNMIFLILTTAVLSMRPNFLHYYAILCPGAILVFPWYFSRLRVLHYGKSIIFTLMVIATVSLSLTILQVNFNVKEAVRFIRNGGSLGRLIDFRDGFELETLRAFSNDIDGVKGVCSIGNSCLIYRKLGVVTKSRYPFQAQPISVSPECCREVKECLAERRDKYLITSEGGVPQIIKTDIETYYKPVRECGIFTLWEARF